MRTRTRTKMRTKTRTGKKRTRRTRTGRTRRGSPNWKDAHCQVEVEVEEGEEDAFATFQDRFIGGRVSRGKHKAAPGIRTYRICVSYIFKCMDECKLFHML